MWIDRLWWALVWLGVALLGSGWIFLSRAPATAVAETTGLSEAPQVGFLAPDFTLTGTNGKQVSLSDYRGQPVVLNFWATWCPPCRAEMPFFQNASVKYNGRAVILGIDQAESAATVTTFAAQVGVSYPLLLDLDSAVNLRYNIRALPTTIFIDASGVIREIHVGIISQAVLEDRIERLLVDG
jgi:cytochrome c biogenesis protein CcmG, thiol:disulfide interchange protein DsbE